MQVCTNTDIACNQHNKAVQLIRKQDTTPTITTPTRQTTLFPLSPAMASNVFYARTPNGYIDHGMVFAQDMTAGGKYFPAQCKKSQVYGGNKGSHETKR